MTQDELEQVKGETKCLSETLVSVQCTKPPEVATKAADVLDTFGHNKQARKLIGWCGTVFKHIFIGELFVFL